MGDILNEVAYHIRPYETEPGKTNEVFAKCMDICMASLREKSYDDVHNGMLSKVLAKVAAVKDGGDISKILDQLRGTYYADVFAKCRRLIEDEIEVDYTRAKPIVKVTGEFWAQTTEGDGNFNMFPFLESQGAEVLVEPVATWLCYMLHQAGLKAGDRRGLDKVTNEEIPLWDVKRKVKSEVDYRKNRMNLAIAEKLIIREFDRLRGAIGGTAHELAPQKEMTRMGHPYYNSRAGGGEGHLEVAKNIYYSSKDMSHMVLSLKPFGCMPSAQSDGAQAAVVSHFKDMIFIPIETSGEGDINAHSRVQMALGEAKLKCKDEFKAVIAKTGYSIEQIREFVNEHRDLRNPLQQVPHHKGVVSRAGNFVFFVAEKMRAAGVVKADANEPVMAGA
jgi:predicted nucleotide-binding protein (sugar kinase/HSP70/actin superfamily)